MRFDSHQKTCDRMKYLIFNNGQILDQIITDNIIGAARRGKITDKGGKTLLVPDKRKGPKTSTGLQDFGSVKKKECLSLINLVPK